MSWDPSDDELERIRIGWYNGESAGQIAALFSQTRNVIIGIVHRRGFTRPGGVASYVRRSPIRRPASPFSLPEKPARPQKVDPVLDPLVMARIHELEKNQCRYPVGGPREDPGLFCGQPTTSTYCEAHAALVYQPKKPKGTTRR